MKQFARGAPQSTRKNPRAALKDADRLRCHTRILIQNRASYSLYDAGVGELDTPPGPQGLVSPVPATYNSTRKSFLKGGLVQLDDHLKQLLRELGHAINDTVSDAPRISEAISEVRAAGFDIVLKLDATIGLARRDANDAKITTNDRRFLESLHIQVDQEMLERGVNCRSLR